MSENSIIPAEAGSLRHGYEPYMHGGAGQADTMPVNPLKALHLFLRGHYILLSILAIILTPLGAWIGYSFGKTEYLSTGIIRVRPELPAWLYRDNDNQIPMFDAFLDVETERVRSERVMSLATANPIWSKWRSPLPVGLGVTLSRELLVTHSGEALSIAVSDADPVCAQCAVQSTIEAYLQLYNDETIQDARQRDSFLDQRRDELEDESDAKRRSILDIARRYNTDDLNQLYQQKWTRLQNIEDIVQRMEFYMSQHPNGAGPAASDASDEELLQQIGKSDTRMSHALDARDACTQTLDELKLTLGDNNDEVVLYKNKLKLANDQVQAIKASYQRSHGFAATASNSLEGTEPTTRPATYAAMKAMYDRTSAELASIGADRLEIEDLKAQKDSIDQNLAETKRKIDEYQVESQVGGRMTVISEGDLPTSPSRDTHLALGALGGSGGLALSVILVACWILSDRRFHGPEDTQFNAARCPMLGMLPTLSQDLSDPEQAAMAAHFVHGIRAMLQIRGIGSPNPDGINTGGRVLAVTSPSAHNGKTSISLALGVSYAGAKSKTLLIDCDFVGRALTARLGATVRPRLGRMLVRSGLIDDAKLLQALEHSGRTGRRLGEVLVDLGFVKTEDMNAVLEAQTHHQYGVMDAIGGEDIIECVTPTAVPGLSILPLGQATAEDIGGLSPAMLRQVLEATRDKYDVVIVDTGPILGSLEAAMVATQADDVVMVVSNGENRAAAERSLHYLEMVGARVAGFVFNRATPRDFNGTGSISRSRANSSASHWRNSGSWRESSLSNFGPVAQAVAHSVSGIDKENGGGNNGNGKAS